jgi:hypothetical protein
MTRRYYGGGPVGMGNAGVFNNASIGATPAGQGPSFPIDQEAWNEADRRKIEAIPRGDVLKRFLEIRRGQNVKGASVPVSDPMGSIGNLGGLQNAQFFNGPQLAQAADLPDQIYQGQEADYYMTPVGSDPNEDKRLFEERFYGNTDLQRLFPNYPVNAPEMNAKGMANFHGKYVS